MPPPRDRDPAREAARYGGVPIWGTLPGSPAHLAGLRKGDVLLRVNGEDVQDLDSFFQAKDRSADQMELLVVRGGQLVEISMSLRAGSKPTVKEAADYVAREQVFKPAPASPPPAKPAKLH